MRLRIVFVWLLVAFTGFAVPSLAQSGGRAGVSTDRESPLNVPSISNGTAGGKYQNYVYGVVKAVDKNEIVLTKTNAGMDQTFKFNKKTKFIHDGKGSSLESVKLGDKVWVDGSPDKKTGDLIARKVVSGAFLM